MITSYNLPSNVEFFMTIRDLIEKIVGKDYEFSIVEMTRSSNNFRLNVSYEIFYGELIYERRTFVTSFETDMFSSINSFALDRFIEEEKERVHEKIRDVK